MKKYKLLTILIICLVSLGMFTGCSGKTAEDGFNEYKEAFQKQDYEKMYSFLTNSSKEAIKKEEFIERYENIYGGIDAENIEISINEDRDDKENIEFSLNMDSIAGAISLDNYKAKMVKEKGEDGDDWFVDWNESLIFPEMEEEDKVRVNILEAKRGEIFDRDGKGLAVNGSRYSIGIHPSKYSEADNNKLASLLDIDEKIIKDKLENNTNPELFIPIVKIAVEDKDMVNKLLAIEGVISQEVEDRVYPGGEAFGNLIGYIKPITAEELEEDEDGIYHNRSLVGNLGLETVYEKELRPKEGKEIYISKIEDGQEVERLEIAKTQAEDGKDIKTNIDTELQRKIYEELNGEVGTSAAIDPKTGQVLAMVSSPSFDSNLYTSYISNSQRKMWEDSQVNVFQNRFNKVYSPGSTFKIVTAAIGLEENLIDPNEKLNIVGKSWQKDQSWGSYKINRVSQKLSNVDLKDAFVYSDNIYFARAALKIGEENFLERAKRFGFGEELPIDFPFIDSQILNDEEFENEILLADTGYGQGQVLMSPLHLSLVYSSLVNDGNIMKASLIQGESEIWKEDIVSDSNRSILLNSLVDVIENKDGTGNDAKIDGIRLAGKTGTAELKLTQEGRGKENGWFVAMDVDDPRIVISTMIEGVEDKGGSAHVIPKVKNIIEYYLKKN